MLVNLSRIFTLIFTLTALQLQASELVLNGIAQQNYFNEAAYFGALFIEKRSNNPDTIKTQKGEKLIEIHFVNGRYPVRIFLDHIIAWSDANTPTAKSDFLTINGSIRDLTARRNFVKGDILTVHLSPSNSSEIKLNKTSLITTNDNQLFNYIAAAWIGNNPANEEFKETILSLDMNDAITEKLVTDFYEPLGNPSIASLIQRGIIPAKNHSTTSNSMAAESTINRTQSSTNTNKSEQYYLSIKNKILASLQKELTNGNLKEIEAVTIYFNNNGKIITAAPIPVTTLSPDEAIHLKEELHDAVIKAAKNISPIPVSSDIAYAGIFSLSVNLH